MKDLMKQVNKDMALIKKGTLELIGEDELKEKLVKYYETGQPLTIKLGLDPSAPDIHLGHTVVLRKIRQFQDMGHRAVLIIGDFTGRIGDPTGKSKTRKQLSEKQVLENADTYKEQMLKVLDPDKTTIAFNSEWLESLTFKEIIELLSKQTLARMLEREGFKKRMDTNEAIFLHELLYPMMQGFDSVNIHADVEIGGMDQKFNILMGRDMQARDGFSKQAGMFLPIIEGIDGVEKMSKSLHNYIGIDESAEVMFEKVMMIPDDLVEKYFTLLTDRPVDEIEEIMDDVFTERLHPKEAKMMLAREIVTLYHGSERALEAEEHFKKVFSKKALPTKIDSMPLDEHDNIITVINRAGFARSNSEARRLIIQNGVKINQEVINDLKFDGFNIGDVLQVGKRKFIKLS